MLDFFQSDHLQIKSCSVICEESHLTPPVPVTAVTCVMMVATDRTGKHQVLVYLGWN